MKINCSQNQIKILKQALQVLRTDLQSKKERCFVAPNIRIKGSEKSYQQFISLVQNIKQCEWLFNQLQESQQHMDNIRYIYVRTPRPLREDPKKPGHLLPTKGTPVGCVAYRIEDVPDQPHSRVIKWAYSVHNPVDRLRKKDGKEVARERLDTDPRATWTSSIQKPTDMVLEMLRNVARSEVHAWAGATDDRRVLSQRFRKACLTTVSELEKKILASQQRTQEAA